LGLAPDWDLDEEYDADRREIIMTGSHLIELPSEFISLGSHSVTHCRLSALPEEESFVELRDSKRCLEEILRREVTLFSFPYGEYNGKLVDQAKQVGYTRVFSILPGPAFVGNDEYITGRIRVDPTDWPIEFRMKVLGAYSWLPRAYESKRLMRLWLSCLRKIIIRIIDRLR